MLIRKSDEFFLFLLVFVMEKTVRSYTWNCEQNSRTKIANLNTTIIQSSSSTSGCRTNNSINIATKTIEKVLIERQYRLCHSKKLYCILLYYEPQLFRILFDCVNDVPREKRFENVMPIVVCRQEQRQRSRRRRRRRHLNSFCDNFKII